AQTDEAITRFVRFAAAQLLASAAGQRILAIRTYPAVFSGVDEPTRSAHASVPVKRGKRITLFLRGLGERPVAIRAQLGDQFKDAADVALDVRGAFTIERLLKTYPQCAQLFVVGAAC